MQSRRLAGLLLAAVFLSLLTGCQQIDPTEPLDQVASDYLAAQGTADAGEAAGILNSIADEKKESSMAESRYEEEKAVAESIKESLATGGKPTGVLTPGKVVSLKESEIPKLRRLFSDTVVIGNSRAKSVLDSGILTENEVLFKWAAHMDEIMDTALQAASLYRGKTLFIMGVNDLGYYMSNTEGWKREYIKVIDAYREVNPYSDIYLQEIIPIPEEYAYRWRNRWRVNTYNEIIKEICAEKDCTMVSSVIYAMPEFLNDDTGAHYDRQYHIYWAQTMANQMGLWEGR